MHCRGAMPRLIRNHDDVLWTVHDYRSSPILMPGPCFSRVANSNSSSRRQPGGAHPEIPRIGPKEVLTANNKSLLLAESWAPDVSSENH